MAIHRRRRVEYVRLMKNLQIMHKIRRKMIQLIKCAYKVLLRNENDKYVYEVLNNNYNLPTCITSVMT